MGKNARGVHDFRVETVLANFGILKADTVFTAINATKRDPGWSTFWTTVPL